MKKMQIGSLIEQARIDRKRSREWLAHEVEVASTTILRWENGTLSPSFEKIVLVAKALNKSLLYFAGEESIEATSIDNSLNLIKKIAALGPIELELLKDNLDELSKPKAKKIRRNLFGGGEGGGGA